jgi:hypothetical protein
MYLKLHLVDSSFSATISLAPYSFFPSPFTHANEESGYRPPTMSKTLKLASSALTPGSS